MKLIKSYPEEMDKRQKFAMMTADNTKRMMDLDGAVIDPEAWVLYEGDNQEGEPVEILTIKADGELFSTVSPIFISKFKDIVEFFEGNTGEILVKTGKTKAGRDYVTVDVAL